MKTGYTGKQLPDTGAYYAPYVPAFWIVPKQTWESYLSRLGNGLNGIAERSKNITEEDIVANAQYHMQKHYPGKYIVEQFYDAKKMKVDLRLVFDSPKDKTWFMVRYE